MSRSFSNVISLLGFTFVAFAVVGCAVEDAEEEEVRTEQSVAVSKIEDEEAPQESAEILQVPVHRYAVPPPIDGKATQGPFPQPWTPDDK